MIAVVCAQGAARADTLIDAVRMAYETNPTLRAQRAMLRSVDEGYAQARSGYGPQVNLTGQLAYDWANVEQPAGLFTPRSTTDYRAGTGTADLTVTQPVYASGSLRAQVRAAAAGILASREDLRQAESDLLRNVVTAYVDVRRDRESLRILRDEIVALTGELNEIRAKGRLGQVTKTDVAQSEARLLSAESQLLLAQGRLNVSNAEYLNVVGQSPGDLAPEPELPGVPPLVDQAFSSAEANNPQLRSAMESERVARERVNQAKAANGPTVALKFDAQAVPNQPYVPRDYDRNVSVALVFNQPLFTSGLNSSKIRQALDEDNRAQLEVEVARRGLIQLVAQTWDELVATRGAIDIQKRQVSAEETAVEGNRIEERVGQRSVIDLLNAELELANTRIGLLQSHHDEYVARATLLSAMGILQMGILDPEAARYDPVRSFDRTKDRLSPPWADAVGAVDGLAAPDTPPPQPSPIDAGQARPADMPPSLAATPKDGRP